MELLDKYIIARWCYAIGEHFIDDIEYGYLEEKVKVAHPENEYLKRSWSDDPCPLELLKRENMMHLYRDIKFAYKSESISSLNNQNSLRAALGGLNEKSRVSFKLDGFNIQVNYYNGVPISAETRGRGGNSLNANTVLKIVPQKIPYLGKVKVTGECVIPNKKWTVFKSFYDNVSQRSSVSTCLANELIEYIEFVAFNIQSERDIISDHYTALVEAGFNIPMFMYCDSYTSLQGVIDMMGKRVERYKYPTDGLVIENTATQLAIRVGAWQESVMKSYIIGYDETVGMHNNPMVVKIAPVKSSEGSTYTTVGVTNIQCILDCDLQIGSPIAFDLRSMSTPVLNATATDDLHQEWAGRYDAYKEEVDRKS